MILTRNSILLFWWYLSFWSCCKATVIIDPSLLDSALADSNVFFTMSERPSFVLDKLKKQSFQDKFEKRTKCVEALRAFAAASQAPVANFLTLADIVFRSFWVSNQIYVPNCSSTLITAIQQRFPDQIKSIDREQVMELLPVIKDESSVNAEDIEINEGILWNLNAIKAPDAWAMGRKGQGCRVAVCDTGINSLHECFENRVDDTIRRDGIAGIDNPPVKVDANGHGTHCAGTIGGRNFGVAPESTLMSCTACNTACPANALLDCGQWAPIPQDNARKGADVVSNSWGGTGGSDWFDDCMNYWEFCDIVGVFANGNSGPACSTASSPADNPRALAVGATDKDNKIASFSSRGPSARNGEIKPNVSAPGAKIVSASNTDMKGNKTMSGTSMACPHVAGLCALVIGGSKSDLDVATVKSIIVNSCTREVSPNGDTCGNLSDRKFPNHHFGNGMVDCLNAINMANQLEAQGVDNNKKD